MRRQWGICSTNPQPNADLAAEPPPSSLHPIETWPDLEHYARSKVVCGPRPMHTQSISGKRKMQKKVARTRVLHSVRGGEKLRHGSANNVRSAHLHQSRDFGESTSRSLGLSQGVGEHKGLA